MRNFFRRNWKTTLAGVATIASAILPVVGVPVDICTAIVSAIGGLGLVLAKDADKTGVEAKKVTK
jgi:hypothetical protein